MEANTHPFCRNQHDIIVAGGESGFNECVARNNLDGNDAASSYIGEIAERSLFDCAGACGEEDAPLLFPGEIFLFIAVHSFHSDDVCNFFAMLQLQYIGDTPPLRGSAEVGDFMHALDVNPAGVREEHQIIMGIGREQMLDEIAGLLIGGCLARFHADHAFSSTALGAEGTSVRAFDQAVVRDSDHHRFVSNEILNGHFAFVRCEVCPAWGGVLFLNKGQFVLNDAEYARFLSQDIKEVFNLLNEVLVLGANLVDFQTGQLIEAQFENGVRLFFAEFITAVVEASLVANENPELLNSRLGEIERHQFHLGFIAVGGFADNLDELIKIRERDDITFQRLSSALSLLQFVTRAPHDDFAAVLDIAIDGFLKRECLGLAVINGEHIDAEGGGQLRVLVEVIDDHLRDRIALELDNDTGVFIGFIADSRDLGENLFIGQLSDALYECGAVDVVGNLGDDNLLFAVAHFLHAESTSHLDGAFASGEIIRHGGEPGDGATGREIRALDILHQPLEIDIGIIDLGADTIDHFTEVMRRHVRGHADGNTGAAIDEQIRE